jgi:hypothetical protein
VVTAPRLPWTCFVLLFFNFAEEKRKKWHFETWDKGSYTGSFLVIVPCTYIL